MRREFELEEVLYGGGVLVAPFTSLKEAQEEPWDENASYRVISEMEIPDHPLTEPLVLNVWHQAARETEWRMLS